MSDLIPEEWTSTAILGDVQTFLGNPIFLALLTIIAAFYFGPKIFRLIGRMLKSV